MQPDEGPSFHFLYHSTLHLLPPSPQLISLICVPIISPEMEQSNLHKQHEPEEPRFLDFPHLPDDATTPDGKPRLNKHSSTVTKGHDFPGAQVTASSENVKTEIDLRQGNAVCCWGPGPCEYEEQSSCRRGISVVGGESMQVGSTRPLLISITDVLLKYAS